MFTLSIVAHVVLLAGLAFIPTNWSGEADEAETLVMTISLGGAPGAQSGGMTPIGGRPVQEETPVVEERGRSPCEPRRLRRLR